MLFHSSEGTIPVPYTLSMVWSYSHSSQGGHTPLPNTSWVSWPYPGKETMAIHGSTAAQHSSACHPPAPCQSQIPRDHQGTEWKQTDVLRKKCLRGTESRFTFPALYSHFLSLDLISCLLMLSLLQLLAPTQPS